jgi:hypothetical protein
MPKSGEALPVIGLGTYLLVDIGNTTSERYRPRKSVTIFS